MVTPVQFLCLYHTEFGNMLEVRRFIAFDYWLRIDFEVLMVYKLYSYLQVHNTGFKAMKIYRRAVCLNTRVVLGCYSRTYDALRVKIYREW
jgi:hypothetical protein